MPEGVGYGPKTLILSRQSQETRFSIEKAGFSNQDSSGKSRTVNKSESTEVLIGNRPKAGQSDLTYENLRPRR